MKRSALSTWLTKVAWGLVALDLLLIFIVPADADFSSLALLVIYAIWIIFTLLIATSWLIVQHRQFFSKWFGWLIPLLLIAVTSPMVQGTYSVHSANLSLFISLLFLNSAWSFGLVTILLLWYRDVGLGLVAWAWVVFIWITVILWNIQKTPLIDIIIGGLDRPGEPFPLWWFGPMACLLAWIVPLGSLSFVAHTLRLIWHECKKEGAKR